MKDKKEQMPWKEALRINFRALRLLYSRFPQIVLSRILCAAWEALTPYLGIYLSALILDELAGGRDVQRLSQLVLLTLGSAAGIALGTALLGWWRDSAGSVRYHKFRLFHAQKMLDMDFVRVDDPKTHELLSKIQQFNNSGGWGAIRIFHDCETTVSSVFTLLGGFALTVTLFTTPVPESAGAYAVLNNPLFLLLIAAVMLALTYVSPALSTKAGSYIARHSDTHSFGNRFFTFYGWTLGRQSKLATDIRIYRQDQFSKGYFEDKESVFGSRGLFAKLAKGPRGLCQAASSAVSVAFTGGAYLFVCLKAWAGAFGVGQVTQYVAAITKAAAGLSALIGKLGDMRNNAPFLQTEFAFLDIPNLMYQGTLPVEKRTDNEYEIEFRNVSFKYPGSDNYALKNLSMSFRVGQRLAVVGMNGSGKTTMIKLLCRLYDPTEGEITLNGIDIKKYRYDEYMGIFSVVFQDFKLFSAPLGQNVAASAGVDEKKAVDCLNKAGFSQRLATMSQGLDTSLYKDTDEDGVDVSGGEAQKIALARALYKNAPFIILDEPTAALDPLAEYEIYSKFNDIVGVRTAIYISHRLSSCRFCDDIVVFDQGRLVQRGSHDGLLADESGKYHQLWYAQAQYYS